VILLTVGMQLGFDRLIRAIDELAPHLPMPVLAQTGMGAYTPHHMEVRPRIAPVEFDALARDAALIVSHAGIGTVLTARRLGKPIVLFPRRAALGEHRNDHQVATARQLQGRPGILLAFEEAELPPSIESAMRFPPVAFAPSPELEKLTRTVRDFIGGETV